MLSRAAPYHTYLLPGLFKGLIASFFGFFCVSEFFLKENHTYRGSAHEGAGFFARARRVRRDLLLYPAIEPTPVWCRGYPRMLVVILLSLKIILLTSSSPTFLILFYI